MLCKLYLHTIFPGIDKDNAMSDAHLGAYYPLMYHKGWKQQGRYRKAAYLLCHIAFILKKCLRRIYSNHYDFTFILSSSTFVFLSRPAAASMVGILYPEAQKNIFLPLRSDNLKVPPSTVGKKIGAMLPTLYFTLVSELPALLVPNKP